jgi:hypothetical protein
VRCRYHSHGNRLCHHIHRNEYDFLTTNYFHISSTEYHLQAARKVDDAYPDNIFFEINDGRPKLSRFKKKPLPEGFKELDAALTKKLDKLELSLLDVLTDTSQWIGWDKKFSPLSGHQGKLNDDVRRKILTTFAYGTGLGATQTARNIADISARQISFINQRQTFTEKLEAAICDTINAYNQFQLPRYWGDTKRAVADGTQWVDSFPCSTGNDRRAILPHEILGTPVAKYSFTYGAVTASRGGSEKCSPISTIISAA